MGSRVDKFVSREMVAKEKQENRYILPVSELLTATLPQKSRGLQAALHSLQRPRKRSGFMQVMVLCFFLEDSGYLRVITYEAGNHQMGGATI